MNLRSALLEIEYLQSLAVESYGESAFTNSPLSKNSPEADRNYSVIKQPCDVPLDLNNRSIVHQNELELLASSFKSSMNEMNQKLVSMEALNENLENANKEIEELRKEVLQKSSEIIDAREVYIKDMEQYKLSIAHFEVLRSKELQQYNEDIEKLRVTINEKTEEANNLEVTYIYHYVIYALKFKF
jgi:ElaB/YqjD/DUF883 family membrane-anchored ribosome-binding protein